MGSKLLSGQELVENGAKKGSIILPNKGDKTIIANGSWLEKKQIESGLEDKKNLLQDQRIEKRNSLSHADWKEDLHKAHVTVKKGPYWSYLGHVLNNKLYILPEEILYLMEVNALLLKFRQVTVSIQQAYSILLGKCISLSEYRIYSTLSKEGYRLIRHNNKFNSCESNKEKDGDVTKSRTCEMESKKSDSEDVPMCSQASTSSQNLLSNEDIPSERNGRTISSNPICSNELVSSKRRKRKQSKDLSEPEHRCKVSVAEDNKNEIDVIEIDDNCMKDKKCILSSIVDCYNKKIVYIDAPKNDLLPLNIDLKKSLFIVDVRNVSKTFGDGNNFISFGNNENNTMLPYNLHYGQNSNRYNEIFRNRFTSNLFFFNQIFHQVSVNSLNLNLYGNQFSATTFRNSYISRTSTHTGIHNINTPQRSLSSSRQSKLILNPYSIEFSQDRPQNDRNTSCDESVSSSSESTNKYLLLLSKFKKVLSQYDINKLRNNKNALELLSPLIKEYNKYFDRNYELNEELLDIQDETSDIVIVDETPRRSSVSDVDENQPEKADSTSNVDDLEMIIDSEYSMKLDFKNWYKADGWNKPETVSSKPKRNCSTLKLSTALLHHVKKLSNDPSNNIQTWRQAKELYDKKSVQETVSISDDESDSRQETDNEDVPYADSGLKIKNDKIESLVRPEDCKTTMSVLKRLQITKPYLECDEVDDEEIKILYDVYLPTQKNLKKSPSLPTYCIVVCNSPGMPLPGKLNFIRSKIPEGVKILYAFVSIDSVFFLQMENIQLPVMVENIKH